MYCINYQNFKFENKIKVRGGGEKEKGLGWGRRAEKGGKTDTYTYK